MSFAERVSPPVAALVDDNVARLVPANDDQPPASGTRGAIGGKPISVRSVAFWSYVRNVLHVVAAAYVPYVVLFERSAVDRMHLAAALYVALLFLAVFHHLGIFSREVIFSERLYLRRILTGWLTVVAISLSAALTLDMSRSFEAEWVRWWFLAALAMLVLDRCATMALVRRWKARNGIHQRAIIIGTGDNSRRLIAHLQKTDDIPTAIVGFVDDRQREPVRSIDGIPVLGTTRELVALVRANQIDLVIVALPMAAARRVAELVHRLEFLPVDLMLAPDLATFAFPSCRLERIAGVPMLHVFERPISGWSQAVKRAEDIIVATAGLVLLSPVLLLAALAVKLDSHGPVLFGQKRYGFNHAIFRVLKFRTMYVAASDGLGAVQAARHDPRVTRVGRFLRRTSLDELPQLINVLRGEMSIVGPRPHALGTRSAGRLFEDAVEAYAARHRVKPGITGWAQIHGLRGETDTVEKLRRRVEFDLYYIESWSLWFDISIILRTLPSLISRHAY